jgi:predicted house-cleaning noncanonical NTP pyrophosphatase (MazG superfamily)
MDNKITILCKASNGKIVHILINPNETISKLIERIINKLKGFISLSLEFNGKVLEKSSTISESGLKNNSTVNTKDEECYDDEGLEKKIIEIQFIKQPKNTNPPNSNYELTSLLKLCLLKEIAGRIQDEKLENLPDLVKLIMEILKKGYMSLTENPQKDIERILERVKGSNIINFSKFVDNNVDTPQLNKLINLLKKSDKIEIIDIKNRLSRYVEDIKLFDKEFAVVMKESIIEFSVISMAVIEREDFEKFEKGKKSCKNRVDRLLFHGTGKAPVAGILTGEYWKSIESGYQHGKGVYFSDKLDYCWYYGNEKDNRFNINKIPEKGVNDTFYLIANSIYYNENLWEHVYDYKKDPEINGINFAYAGAETETLYDEDFDEKKFYGTEYVIWELSQICPFIGAKLQRAEYCCIWRDNNFSSKPVYNNEFDDIFKEFLKNRMAYIEQYAEFNIYPCQTTEEAIKLIKRKKYNKIILLSNIGSDLGGKKFIDEARKILKNDVIVLFLAYNIDHLDWVKDYKNALFSNEPDFYEQYLECFSPTDKNNFTDDDIVDNILTLKDKMESHYGVKFNFTNTFLEYPLYKGSGEYSKLIID